MKKIFSILTFIFLAVLNILFAQHNRIRFEKISIEQGLSQSSVIAVLQDRKGFMWFGTYDGVNRYDGFKFKIFRHKHDDSTSLTHNLVGKIYEDRYGELWLGTNGGLNKYVRDKESFIQYIQDDSNPNSISNNRIRDIYEDRNGALWIGTENGLNKFDREKNIFIKYYHNPNEPKSISNNFIRVIHEDEFGNLYLGTNDGLNIFNRNENVFICYKHNQKDIYSISSNIIYCIAEDETSLWIGTGNGLNRFDKKSGKFFRYQNNPNDKSSLSDNVVRSVLVDRLDELWVGTYNGGLAKFDRKKSNFVHYKHYSNDPYSIGSNSVWRIYEDRSGILWIGTDFGGVNKFDRRKNQFIHYSNDPNNLFSLTNNEVHAIYEEFIGGKKRVWIGTRGGGIYYYDYQNEKFKNYSYKKDEPNSLSNNIVRCINRDKFGFIWIGTDDGLNKFDPQKQKFLRYKHDNNRPGSLSSNLIRTIYEDKNGTLWIGTYRGGLEQYNRATDEFIHYQNNPTNNYSISDNIIWSILEDRTGRLWIGTDAGGLNWLDRGTGRFYNYKNKKNDINSISDNKVLCILEDRKGYLWLGTAGGGLNKFNSSTEVFKRYTEENGLSSNTVQSILEDDNGNLWIGTTHGLSKFNVATESFVSYHIYDGLQGNEFNVNSCYKGENGELYFGGNNGFNVFNPENIKQDSFIAPIVITDFQLFGKSLHPDVKVNGRVILTKSITETQEIILSHSDDIFSIEFASLDFTAPNVNHYAFKMEGLEENWNEVGNRRFATYTKLPKGKYLFRVKGSNENNVWNENGIGLSIIITPAFWETLWFRVLAGIFIIGILILGYKYRTARIRAHNRELQQRVAERTADLEAFAYSISHDLRTPLRAIDGFTNILLEDHTSQLNEDGKRVCTIISGEIKRMNQLIDDFLSFSKTSYVKVNASKVDMENLVHSVFQELTTPEIRERTEFNVGSLPNTFGDPSLLREVWMNLISNAIKFSSKQDRSIIEIGAYQYNNQIVYWIKDNGVGFDMQYYDKLFSVFQRLHSVNDFEGTGVGLAIVKRLITHHKGRVWAEGNINKGATFYFTVSEKGEENE